MAPVWTNGSCLIREPEPLGGNWAKKKIRKSCSFGVPALQLLNEKEPLPAPMPSCTPSQPNLCANRSRPSVPSGRCPQLNVRHGVGW